MPAADQQLSSLPPVFAVPMTSSPKPFEMPDYVIERVMKKRGKLRIFDRFEPSETALVVIDMQNYYVLGCRPCTGHHPQHQ